MMNPLARLSIGDRFSERDSGRAIDDIDSSRRKADLLGFVVSREVALADLERRQGRAESGECLVNPSRVARRSLNRCQGSGRRHTPSSSCTSPIATWASVTASSRPSTAAAKAAASIDHS